MNMGLPCKASVAKYLLFFFNFIIWVVGIVLLTDGICTLVGGSSLLVENDWNEKSMKDIGVGLCVMGALIFVVAGLGCWGAIIESINCLMLFAGLVLLLIVAQFCFLIYMGVIYHDEVYNETYNINNKAMVEYYGHNRAVTRDWNDFQKEYQCCGSENGPEDWRKSKWYNNNLENQPVPISCCTNYNRRLCFQAAINETMPGRERYVHVKGCEQYVRSNKTARLVNICILVALLLVQLVMVIMACCLRSNIEDSFPTVPYTVFREASV